MAELIGHLVNIALSLLMWLIIGRIALTLITGDTRTFFSEFFRRTTEPVYQVVRRMLPIPERLVPLAALLLIIALRILLLPLLRAG
ncbi:YggT family protein [Thermomicrobiaceae bacterium CFH 74404]|uniref:YggT family protein n=1 Tax=Thermalbibacter longus TaxID=2951981 RepID=A0AA41WCR7_9BACT|nr:YggT family protein [Thermalbibacter longus]MCM8750492.1 YggT family protein [Thermalbibacter longus]